MSTHYPTIYLAGPDVFLPNAEEVGRKKQQMCLEFGFEGLFPLDNDEKVHRNPKKIYSEEIFRLNRSQMDGAKIGLFNLTPFRGPSADPGTVFELGYMCAQEKRLFGYTSDESEYWKRVGSVTQEQDYIRDANGFSVEPFGLIDNLVIVRSIADSGGFIEKAKEELKNQVEALPAFTAFRACLQKLKQRAALGEFEESKKHPDTGRTAWAGSRK
jgi:nucleoside 2-deoxyribosyltransferase